MKNLNLVLAFILLAGTLIISMPAMSDDSGEYQGQEEETTSASTQAAEEEEEDDEEVSTSSNDSMDE